LKFELGHIEKRLMLKAWPHLPYLPRLTTSRARTTNAAVQDVNFHRFKNEVGQMGQVVLFLIFLKVGQVG
jgi:hypothetical protein